MAVGNNPVKGTDSERLSVHLAHGIVSCLAILFWFPTGVFLLRFLKLKCTVRFHALWQTFGLLILLIGLGLGSRLSDLQGGLFDTLHVAIGLVVAVGFLLMPVVGWLHHKHFARHGYGDYKRGVHVWGGRILLLLGIVAGGTGLDLADDSSAGGDTHVGMIAYGVVAVVLVIAYGAVWFWSKRQKKMKSLQDGVMEQGIDLHPRS